MLRFAYVMSFRCCTFCLIYYNVYFLCLNVEFFVIYLFIFYHMFRMRNLLKYNKYAMGSSFKLQ